MTNAIAKTKGPLTAVPPPSLTESQRRLLADPYRLEGEGQVAWERPSVLPDPQRVTRVLDELERGLTPTRPEFLKWICDKLSALPTQTATGMNAALWTDNVIDVCERYPEDLLQTACLELLRSCTFRPSPAEIVKVIDDRFEERKRMLDRARQLLPDNAPKPGQPFVAEPIEHRLRHAIWRGWEAKTGPGHFMAPRMWEWACRAERELAALELREAAAWARIDGGKIITVPEAAPKPSAANRRTRDRLAELAQRNRGGVRPTREEPRVEESASSRATSYRNASDFKRSGLEEPPAPDDVPEGEDYGQDEPQHRPMVAA